jgi:UDP-glucose:(heptosyl)LPS alpha-1,3-glucosyltransferase
LMRILLVTRGFNKRGGVSRTSLEAAERLAKMGHEITVLANRFDPGYSFPNIELRKIGLLRLPSSCNLKLRNLIEIPQFAVITSIFTLFVKRRYDIVWNKGVTQCLVQDVITAESCHRAWIREKKAAGEKRYLLYPLHAFLLAVERWNMRPGRSRKITAISDLLKKDILRNYPAVSGSDIAVIRNGVNTADFAFDAAARSSIRKRWGIAEDDLVILFTGWEFDRKGLEYVIRALPLLERKDVRLMVVGGATRRRYLSIAEESGVSDRILWCGGVEDPAPYYSAADFFVFPTRMDAFGLVVLEAMCAGNIVITSDMAGAAELIEHGRSGFILKDRQSPREIAGIIEMLAGDRSLREKVRSGAMAAAQRSGWDSIAAEYDSLFRAIK